MADETKPLMISGNAADLNTCESGASQGAFDWVDQGAFGNAGQGEPEEENLLSHDWPNVFTETVPIAERFVSINGEGAHAGKLAAFIRFPGCNLDCTYCDTKWARDPQMTVEFVQINELCAWVAAQPCSCVTITGGEPTLQSRVPLLVQELARLESIEVIEIETNGSTNLSRFAQNRPEKFSFTMDYKLPSSGMEARMWHDNFSLLRANDVVKFVVGSYEDLERMVEVIREYDLGQCCQVYISPVFGAIDPAEIVDFMKEHALVRAILQLQLHKFIWPDQERGV